MSLLKDAIKEMALKGRIEHEVTIGGSTFTFRNLTTEEQLLIDSTANLNSVKKKYDDKEVQTYGDTLVKIRNLVTLSFAIKEINGQPPVDENASLQEQYAQRKEFREELSELSPILIDELLQKGHNKVYEMNKEFYKDLPGNSGK